ncbi:YciI family protein [Actinomadura scrupuli]|uniref:YciI family protein n=1 Tax=Actinomadura scrupuli TaxID=559629 RepID=UPI003D980992
MKYLLMIYSDPAVAENCSESDLQALAREHAAFDRGLAESGELVGAEGLAHPTNAKTVRVLDGVPTVTDGPYTAAREHLAGYYVIDCESVERAIELASGLPAGFSAAELRPVMARAGLEM